MKKRTLTVLLIALAIIANLRCGALTPVQDRNLWLMLQVTKQLPKNFNISFQYKARFNNDVTRFNGETFYGIAGYKFNKYLSTQVQYRFFTSRQINRHTFFADLYGKYTYKSFTIGLRSAYQYSTEYFNARYEDGHEPYHTWRNRLLLKYKINDYFALYAYCEPYLRFTPKANARGIYVNRVRNLAGLSWNYNKYNTVTLFYLFQPEFGGKRPQYQHIFGLMYEINLPKKVKWKKTYRPGWYKKKGKEDNGDKDDPLFD